MIEQGLGFVINNKPLKIYLVSVRLNHTEQQLPLSNVKCQMSNVNDEPTSVLILS